MSYDAGHPCCADFGIQQRTIERLKAAVEALYFAAHWSPDRVCDATALWAEARDAAGIPPGQTAARLGLPR